MSVDQSLKDLLLKTLDSWSSKFLNRLVNILTGTPNEKVKNDHNLSDQFGNFLRLQRPKIILLDSISKVELTTIENSFTPMINSLIVVTKTNTHICDMNCYENNYSCTNGLIKPLEVYQVVDYPTLKDNSMVEVLVKKI